MPEPKLQPGETVQRVIRSSDAAILRSAGMATLLAGVLLFLIAGGDDAFDWPRFLISVALFGGVMLAAGLALDRGREWISTDRRIIDPRGRALVLNPDLRIRRLIYALKLSHRGQPAITLRGVPDLGDVTAEIRRLAWTPPEAR